MKTDSPAPDHEELKSLLAQSFHSEEAGDVPPLPDDLRDRIRDQYGPARTTTTTEERSESLWARLSRLFAQPQFSGAAAAVVLIAVAAFLLLPERTAMRGTTPPSPATAATIVLHGFDAAQAESIKGVLDPSSIRILEDISNEPSAEGATIIIDATAGRIEGYASPDAEARLIDLPEGELEIAEAVARMLEDLKGP